MARTKSVPAQTAIIPSSTPELESDFDDTPIATIRTAPSRPSLPRILKFPLVVLINFSITVLLNTILVEFTGPKLWPVARDLREDWQIGVVTGWKVLELGVMWFAGFDGLDALSFSLLTHAPHAYLLHNFYLVPPTPLRVFLVSEALAISLPFHLLSRRNAHHRASKWRILPASTLSSATSTTPSSRLSTSFFDHDWSTFLVVSTVAAAMYAIPVVLSLTTWLPLHLASTFYGLKTLDPAHAASLPTAVFILFQTGLLATDYLFNSTVAYAQTITVHATPALTGKAAGTTTTLEFDPKTATLAQTLHRNMLWHMYLPARTQELLKRATLLVVWTAANTAFLALSEVDGVEAFGAVGWASVWGVGAAMASGMVGWIAGVTV